MQDPADFVPEEEAAPPGEADLTAHLDGLFTLAQALTLDAVTAAQLVEATYRRAYDFPAPARPTHGVPEWLYGLMVEVYGEHLRAWAPGEESPLEAVPPPRREEAVSGLRRRLAERFLDRVLPGAFAALPEDYRLLLVLCEVQGFSSAEAGRVLGLEEEEAARQLREAQYTLRTALRAGATDVERRLLDLNFPEDELRTVLQHTVETEFVPTPPTLRVSTGLAPEEAGPASGDAEAEEGAEPEAVALEAVEAGAGYRALEEESGSLAQRFGRFFPPVLLILIAGVVGYLLTTVLEEEPERNLIVLSAREAEDVSPTLRTESPEQAERFIQDELGWRLTVPGISEAALVGVGLSEVAPGVQVPVLLYQDHAAGLPVTLYVYSYAVLDRLEGMLQLETDVRNELEDETHFDLHDLGEERVLLWRNRDDIFVAVTRGDGENLRERISFPS